MPAAASLHCLVVDDQMTMRSLVRTSLQQSVIPSALQNSGFVTEAD